MGSFLKIILLQNDEIALSFTDTGKSCPNHEILMCQICLLLLFAKIKFSQKFRICPFKNIFALSSNKSSGESAYFRAFADNVHKVWM